VGQDATTADRSRERLRATKSSVETTTIEGELVTLTVDTLGRVVGKTSAVGTSTVRYSERRGEFPNWGRLTTALSPGTTPGVTNTLTINYDALGRLRRRERSIPEAGFLGAVTKGYDQVSGILSTLVYPDGESIGPFGYDSAGRLTSIPGILQSVTYDAAGRPLEQRNANGTVTTRTYVEHRGVLDTLVTTHPTTGTIQSLHYGYDDDLPLVTSVHSPEPADRWAYGYDDGNRLNVAGALYSRSGPPSIPGGLPSTVAVKTEFLGLSRRALRQYGTEITITPADGAVPLTGGVLVGEIVATGGPPGPYSVSDIGDKFIQADPNVRFDLYRFTSDKEAFQFGLREYPRTVRFPTESGGTCPAGWTAR
jgi:YD repeat-containing protein